MRIRSGGESKANIQFLHKQTRKVWDDFIHCRVALTLKNSLFGEVSDDVLHRDIVFSSSFPKLQDIAHIIMNKSLSWLTLLAIIFATAPVFSQVSKEEQKYWQDKAKSYAKDPMLLKAEMETMQVQIRDLKKANKELMDKTPSTSAKQVIDSLRWAMMQQEKEIETLSNQKDRLESAYRALKTTSDQGVKPGLVYRVQIGAFVFYEMSKTPQDEDFMVERSDGYNKYIMGNFRTVDEATAFVEELKKVGIKTPWVVPYIDGVRVTNREAEDYLKKQASQF